MNKKIFFAMLLILSAALCMTACSVNDNENELITKSPQSTAEESVAVSAFYPITNIFEDITDEIQSETETDYFTANRTSSKPAEKTTKPIIPSVITTTKSATTRIITTTAAPTARQTVKVTINEGDSLTQIFKKLDENGVADFDALMETAQTYDYSYYPLIAAIPSNQNRCFRLEGYLFPDTYEFYTNQKPQDAIGKFLRNGKAKITDSMMSQAAAIGYNMDEVLTVASIIEKEGANSAEVSKIAAVIYNRLEAGMKLQMDSTIYYIERNVKPYLTGDINRYNSHYNTYKCSALPAGPISNPGMTTIKAALNPADVDYLYFCHDESANYYYAETYEEHQENLKIIGIE